MKIPCEVFNRLSHIIDGWHDALDPVYRTVRLDNGMVIATDRKLMVVEHVPQVTGVAHITLPDSLIAACVEEAKYGGSVEIAANPMLGYTIAKTTFGHITENIHYAGDHGEFARWRDVIADARKPLDASAGVMVWNADDIARLGAASPSGCIEFSRYIDATARCTVVRDTTTSEWVGFFMPRVKDGLHHTGATVPGWCL